MVVDHVVAAVGEFGGIERAQPDGVHAEGLQIVHLGGDAANVT